MWMRAKHGGCREGVWTSTCRHECICVWDEGKSVDEAGMDVCIKKGNYVHEPDVGGKRVGMRARVGAGCVRWCAWSMMWCVCGVQGGSWWDGGRCSGHVMMCMLTKEF